VILFPLCYFGSYDRAVTVGGTEGAAQLVLQSAEVCANRGAALLAHALALCIVSA